MAEASWTTTSVFTGRGGARTEEAGIVTGELTVRTTWSAGQADVAVQYSGTSQWFTLTGSPVRCPTRQDSRNLHQAVVEAVKAGDGATVPHQHLFGKESQAQGSGSASGEVRGHARNVGRSA
ncbi:hypothetical protein [Streptomyces sp. NPDC046942]|uniref:hypothetical protein n=1 Tax=Streptomyces sp. NPDC046942 TaxID=3155137 RepID=UPI00340ABA12